MFSFLIISPKGREPVSIESLIVPKLVVVSRGNGN